MQATVKKLLLICATFVAASATHAADRAAQLKALEFFQSGEQALQSYQYDKALQNFQSALELVKDDGNILIEENIVERLAPFGRSVKSVTVDESSRALYEPNQRIAHINQVLSEQFRRANPPQLELKWVTFREPTRDNILDGGENGVIEFELANVGKSKALQVVVQSAADNAANLTFEKRINIGDINPQSSATFELALEADKHIEESQRVFNFQAKEQGGYDSQMLTVNLATRAHQPAVISIASTEIRDFNNDHLIEPTENVTVIARVYNSGKGVSDHLKADLQLGENVFLSPDSRPAIDIGKIYPGELKELVFGFLTNRRFTHNQKIPVSVQIRNDANSVIAAHEYDLSMHINKSNTNIAIAPGNPMIAPMVLTQHLDVDTRVPKRLYKNEHAVAVVIGNKRYTTAGVPEVRYAHNDARSVKQYLIHTLGYAENNIIYVEDAGAATLNEIFGSSERYAGKLYNYVVPRKSEVFIYYSGHGAPDIKDKNAFFVPVDANPNYIANSGYSLETFYKNLGKLPAKRITVVLDTCFSGNSDGGALFKNISPVSIGAVTQAPTLKNVSIFVSSGDNQVSTWFHDKRHGLFTYYFLKGISGDADGNGDKRLTNLEIHQYIKRNVLSDARKLNGNEQTPVLTQATDAVMVDYAAWPSVSIADITAQ